MRVALIKNTIALLLAVATGSALAQFAWIDASGTHQYSDRPPPASVPKSKILKQPGAEFRNSRAEAEPATPDAVNNAAAVAKAGQTTAEKNADYNKRKSAQADKDRKTADAAKEASDKAKNCERAQAYNRSLQSGERIASTDKNGEKTYLSDDKRAQDIGDTKRVMESCK